MAVHKKYMALGRGLDALISTEDDVNTLGSSRIGEIDINRIVPNPDQPRKEMDEGALQELANSISKIGIIQPITLRQMDDGTYQIIAGERRWRAARLAGLTAVPAYVRTATDEKMMQMALVENIQREDLNAIEISLAYNNLIQQFKLTQEQLADQVGKKRVTVTNYLRLLKLPADVQIALRNKEIDQGHARALLGLERPSMQLKLFREIMEYHYSVRKVEEMVQAMNRGETVKSGKHQLRTPRQRLSKEYSELKDRLSEFFQTNVQMTVSPSGKGRISISFGSSEDLERLLALLDKKK
jgi:ParB family chromosome partitioning protein